MRSLLAVLLFIGGGVFSHALAMPIAMVTEISGTITSNENPVVAFTELEANTYLALADKATATLVYLQTGQEYQLQGPARVFLENNGVSSSGKNIEGQRLLASTSGAGINLASLSQAAIVMRAGEGEENPVKMIFPAGSKILETHPVFRWQSYGKNYNYRLELLSQSGNSLFTTETSQSAVSLPSKITLPKGELLTWEIEASRGSISQFNSADFVIASEDEAATIRQQRPADTASDSQLVLYAWMLEKNGYRYEAHKYWKILVKRNPGSLILQAKLKKANS